MIQAIVPELIHNPQHLPALPRYAYGPTGRRYRLLDAQEMRIIRDNRRFTWRGVLKWFSAA